MPALLDMPMPETRSVSIAASGESPYGDPNGMSQQAPVQDEASLEQSRALVKLWQSRIKADKRRYVTYFKEGWAAGDPAVQALTADDFNLGRIQLREPTPIPEDEARWAWDWMASWGVLHGTFDAASQINRKVEREAHELAALSA